MEGEDEDDHLGRSSRGGDLPLLDAASSGVPSAEGKGDEEERYRESMSEMYVHNYNTAHVPLLPFPTSTRALAMSLTRSTHVVPLAIRSLRGTPLRSLSPPGPFPRRFIEGSSGGENEALRFVLAAKFVTDALEGRAIHNKYCRQELINPSVKERILSSKM